MAADAPGGYYVPMNRLFLVFSLAAIAAFGLRSDPACAVEPRVAAYGSNILPIIRPFPWFRAIGNNRDMPPATINQAGYTAFMGILDGAEEDRDDAVVVEGDGRGLIIARAGDPAAGLPAGALYGEFAEEVHLNNAGQASFSGRLQLGVGGVDASNDSAFWTQTTSGAVQLVAREGDQPPGLPAGARFGDLSSPFFSYLAFPHALNHAGRASFVAPLQQGHGGVTADNDSALWSQGGGSLALVARKGDHAPGTPADVLFDDWGSFPLLTDAGHLAFVASLRSNEEPLTSSNNLGIWAQRDGGVELVARNGDPAAGVAAGARYQSVFQPRFDAQSHIYFGGSLTGAGITPDNDQAIWSDRGEALQPILRAGEQVPGLPTGVAFDSLGGFSVNAASQVAVNASMKPGLGGVDESNNGGIWVERNGSLQLIARQGSPAPGLTSDFTFLTLGTPEINAVGQVAFRGQVFTWGSDNVPRTLEGIWAEDSDGQLRLVVRREQTLILNPYAGRDVVKELRLSNTGAGALNGMTSSFNDAGDVAFSVGAGFRTLEGGYFTEAILVANADDGILLASDFDDDGAITAADLAVWQSANGQISRAGDANRDFVTDGADFLIWQRELGRVAPGMSPTSAAPEPASLAIAAVLSILLGRMRRHSLTR